MNLRQILIWVAALSALCAAFWIGTENRNPPANDFAAYWTAGHELAAGRNPYSMRTVLALERELGFTEKLPLVMRNPPWALPLTLPFGVLPYGTAQRLWMCLCAIAIAISTQPLWGLYATDGQPVWIAWLVVAAYLPVATVLSIGQMGPLILLGLAMFLYLEIRRKDFWAGAFIFLIALKGHLALLFWPALLFWVLQQRRWRVLAGAGTAVILACMIALGFDREVFSQYNQLWQQTGLIWTEIPTLGGLLNLLVGGGKITAFLPVFAALGWFAWLWMRKAKDWCWRERVPMLMLVSVVASPYAWFFDQVVLVPALLQATAIEARPGRNWRWFALAYVAINALVVAQLVAGQRAFAYVWTGSAWLLLYLAVKKWSSPESAHRRSAGAPN